MAQGRWWAVGLLLAEACADGASPQPSEPGNTTPATAQAPGLGPFVCPSGPYAEAPIAAEVTAELVAGAPPDDDFASDTDQIILEGPVWHAGVLYLSEINSGTAGFGGPALPSPALPNPDVETDSDPAAPNGGARQPPPSRLLSVTEDGTVAIALPNSGSNGLAVDNQDSLVACDHETGAIVRLGVAGQTPAALVTSYDSARFNSPNDLTFGADGTLYFSDPDYQAPSPAPQTAIRAYRLPPGAQAAIPIVETRRQPNGITLLPDRTTLYVSAEDGVEAYPVLSDGSLGAGETFAPGVVRSSDGMAVDCAGNLYTTAGQTVTVVDATGALVGRISVPGVQSVTNVAFGSADHQTLYITTLGSGQRVGLFKLRTAIAGMPY